MRDSFDDLNAIFDQDSHFKWISQRVKRMESKWLEAARNLSAKPYSTKWKQKKVRVVCYCFKANFHGLLCLISCKCLSLKLDRI